jgi:hypothetical protein
VLGLSSSLERERFGVQVGGYVRSFQTASPGDDRRAGWEYVIDARPYVVISHGVQAAVDLSLQQRFPDAISPTAGEQLSASVWAIAPMLLVSPFGPGAFSRPQLRLVYRLAHLDEGARDLHAIGDPRRDQTWAHYLGVQAEWWFNSTYR